MQTVNLNDTRYSYTPSPKQRIFHSSPCSEKLFGGAIGGGKSRAICEEGERLSLLYPGNRGYMCRKDGTDFKKTVLDPVLLGEVLDPRLIREHNKSEQRIILHNDSEIYYGGAEKAELGWSLGWFAVDQCEQIEKKTFDNLLGRLRLIPNGKQINYYALLTANPAPGWVKDRYIPPGGTVGVYRNGNKIYIPARPSENPGVPADYEQRLRDEHDEAWVRRYVEGDWASFAGRVYQISGEQIRPFSKLYEPGKRVYLAVDFGYRRSAVLWLQPRGDMLVAIDELNATNTTTPELAKRVSERNATRKYRVRNGYCDPAGAATNLQTGISDIVAFKNESGLQLLYTTSRQLRDVVAGVRRLQSRIKTANGQRNLYVARQETPDGPGCNHLLNCIENYCYPSAKDNQALKEEPIKDGIHDHPLDALRYFEVGFYAPGGRKRRGVSYG